MPRNDDGPQRPVVHARRSVADAHFGQPVWVRALHVFTRKSLFRNVGLPQLTSAVFLVLTLAVLGSPRAAAGQAKDTLRATKQLDDEIIRYSREWYGSWLRLGKGPWARLCDADKGEVCLEGVIPNGCPDHTSCQPNIQLADFALKAAQAHEGAGFVVGFATFVLTNAGRQLEAFKVATDCQAADWWCALLRGYVLRAVGRLPAAEQEFRRGLAAAPDSVACTFVDASWVVESDMRARLRRLPCARRMAVSDSIWWLADPSYATPGNERWTEQVARMLYRQFDMVQDSLRYPGDRSSWSAWAATAILPRGPLDSWRNLAAPDQVRLQYWTSRKAAHYHFVPDLQGDDLSHPIWHLDGTMRQEGYTPPTVPFYEIPAQVARFRQGDSMMVAVAGTLAGTPMARAAAPSAHLILSDAPDSFPLKLASAFLSGRAVFMGQAAAKRWITSFEALSADGIGRHRLMLEPLQVRGPGVSDVLLYSPAGPELPDSLRMAAGMMLGDTTVAKGDQLGIYWETYGASKGTPVTVELEVKPEGGGLLSQIKNLVPGLGPSSSSRPSWTATSPGPVFRRAVVLDVSDVDSGTYTLVVKTSWPGQEAKATSRGFVVR